ncbi:uncharacterized protein LOC114519005 [Dendronephthya gigantea]|uniref:uncharacterized protein LOC114519005 n=1 Tax=Dendronephthya gigantea TaxID=151771 RepID=UPI00106B6041|nr:uncharacterized protein LOC114519005 [Dendronephthya gigantea]
MDSGDNVTEGPVKKEPTGEQCETNSVLDPVNENEENIYQSAMIKKAQEREFEIFSRKLQTSGKPCTSSALDSVCDGKDIDLTPVKKALPLERGTFNSESLTPDSGNGEEIDNSQLTAVKNVQERKSQTCNSETQTSGKPCLSSVNDDEGSNNYHHQSTIVKNAQERELETCGIKTPQTSDGKRPNVDEEVCQKKHIKIRDINDDIFKTVCKRLQFENARGHDWRGLAGKLGYTVDDVQMFKLEKDSAEKMLHDWDHKGRHYLNDLVKKLLDMERRDVADLLEEEIKRIGEGCNCVNCGSIR